MRAMTVPAPRLKPPVSAPLRFDQIIQKPYMLVLKNFQQKLPLRIERGHYVVKTVESMFELEEVLSQRYNIFYRELLDRRNLFKIDMDRYDFLSDHLVIIDTRTDAIIGTYRLISSHFSDHYYSETEFSIDAVKDLPGHKLELGRACIAKEYRNGFTFALLWRGVVEYARRTDTRYLFGCSSVKTIDHQQINDLYTYVRQHHYSSPAVRVAVKPRYASKIPFWIDDRRDVDALFALQGRERLMPSLLASYLKAGAVICGEPAIDRAFKCADLFTLLDMSGMRKSYETKFSD